MQPSVIVWDLETVPDLGGFAAANDLVGKSDVEVREAIGDKFPKHIYHSIVCIAVRNVCCDVLVPLLTTRLTCDGQFRCEYTRDAGDARAFLAPDVAVMHSRFHNLRRCRREGAHPVFGLRVVRKVDGWCWLLLQALNETAHTAWPRR